MTHPFVSTTIGTLYGSITVNATLKSNAVDDNGMDDSFGFIAVIDCPVTGYFGLRAEVMVDSYGDVHSFSDTNHSINRNARLDRKSLLWNGREPVILSHTETVKIFGHGAQKFKDMILLFVQEPGLHVVTALYSIPSLPLLVSWSRHMDQKRQQKQHQLGIPYIPPFPEPKYPAYHDSIDRKSQGNGLFDYGKDGYILFGVDGNGGDLHRLPSYIANLTVRRHGFPGWVIPGREVIGFSEVDPAYLPLNSSRYKRGLGRVGFDDEGAGDINCILVDVQISSKESSSKNFSLSVYSLATSDKARHAIRIMDEETFNVIAPTVLVEKYSNGVWWTLHLDRSVRLKFMSIKGISISAVAFKSAEF
jgi:hypothetical protein